MLIYKLLRLVKLIPVIFLRFLIIRKMLIEIPDNAFSCLEINKTYYIELKENSKCSARYEKVEI